MRALLVAVVMSCSVVLSVQAGETSCTSRDALTILPPSPTELDSIELRVSGQSPNLFPTVLGQNVDVVGNVLRLTAEVDPGTFLGPDPYSVVATAGPLSRGFYQVEYYVQCIAAGDPVGAPYLAASVPLEVLGADATSVPTLSTSMLVALVLLLGFAAFRRIGTRRSPRSS